jgi:transposase
MCIPLQMRATRDLLRRRCHMVNRRAELITHIQNTITQYNLPPFEGKIGKRGAREGLLAHFPDPQVRNSVGLDLAMIEQYDALLPKLERHIRSCAKQHDPKAFTLLRSIHGADLILPLVILYEIHTIGRFPRVQDFVSYCRAVKPGRSSNGKLLGHAGGKIGNAHLKWAFGELATTPLTRQPARPGPARAAEKTARPGQGPGHPGRQARPRGVLHAQARTALRPGQVLPRLIRSRRRELDA